MFIKNFSRALLKKCLTVSFLALGVMLFMLWKGTGGEKNPPGTAKWPHDQFDQAGTVTELRTLLRNLQNAYESQNLEKLLSFYADNLVITHKVVEGGKETAPDVRKINRNQFAQYLKERMASDDCSLENLKIAFDHESKPIAIFTRNHLTAESEQVKLRNFEEVVARFDKLGSAWKIEEENIVEYVSVPEFPKTAPGDLEIVDSSENLASSQPGKPSPIRSLPSLYSPTAGSGSSSLGLAYLLRNWRQALKTSNAKLYERISALEYKTSPGYFPNLALLEKGRYQNVFISHPLIKELYNEQVSITCQRSRGFWGRWRGKPPTVEGTIELALENRGGVWKIKNERISAPDYPKSPGGDKAKAKAAVIALLLALEKNWRLQKWDDYFLPYAKDACIIEASTYSSEEYKKKLQRENYLWTNRETLDLHFNRIKDNFADLTFTQAWSEHVHNDEPRILFQTRAVKLEKRQGQWRIVEDRETRKDKYLQHDALAIRSQTIEGLLFLWKEAIEAKDIEKYNRLCTLDFMNTDQYRRHVEFIRRHDIKAEVENAGRNAYLIKRLPVVFAGKLTFKEIGVKTEEGRFVLTDENFDSLEGICLKTYR